MINSLQAFRTAMRKAPLFLILSLALAACSSRSGDSDSRGEGIYLPPSGGTAAVSLAFAPDLTATAVGSQTTIEALRPTPTPLCTNNLRFLADLTIPDGMVVAPGDMLDKQWQVENNGTCNWDERYRLKLSAGPELGVPPEQALYPARSGTQAVINMLFHAPADPGIYRSAWQAYSPQNEAFGDPFFIDVVVQAP